MTSVTSTVVRAIAMYHVVCGRRIATNRGLLLHLNACRRKQQEQQNQQSEANDD